MECLKYYSNEIKFYHITFLVLLTRRFGTRSPIMLLKILFTEFQMHNNQVTNNFIFIS
jgi:hypothetical protein